MKSATILHDVSPEQITNMFGGLQNQLNDIKENLQPKEPLELLTRAEVSEMLKCDLSTLHNWCKKGKLIPYGIGNRVYFKRSDIEKALTPFGKNKGENE